MSIEDHEGGKEPNPWAGMAHGRAMIVPDPITQAAEIVTNAIKESMGEVVKAINKLEMNTVINGNINVSGLEQPATEANSGINAKTVAIEVNKFSIALHDTLEDDTLSPYTKAQQLRSIVTAADAVVKSYLQRYEAAVIEETNEQNAREK